MIACKAFELCFSKYFYSLFQTTIMPYSIYHNCMIIQIMWIHLIVFCNSIQNWECLETDVMIVKIIVERFNCSIPIMSCKPVKYIHYRKIVLWQTWDNQFHAVVVFEHHFSKYSKSYYSILILFWCYLLSILDLSYFLKVIRLLVSQK